MTALEFDMVCNFFKLVNFVNDDEEPVEAVMNPIYDENELIGFDVKCASIKNGRSCSRILYMEDILKEENYKEYFCNNLVALVLNCLEYGN